jgi:hypothetical protein
MNYMPEHSGPPIASPNSGFWLRGQTVYDVTTSSHITFLVEHPDLFEISAELIRRIYSSHSETIGTEGKARDELVKLATSRGWVRVRHYDKPRDYWSIQCDKTETRKRTIHEFIEWALSKEVMMEHDSAVILGFADPKDRYEVRWEKGGIRAYLNER